MGADLSVRKTGRLVLVSDHWKVYFWEKEGKRRSRERDRRKEVRWAHTRKNTEWEGQDFRGEREELALPKAIKVWFTYPLNKSTYSPSLPFFQVCGSYHSVPTPTLPLALFFPLTLAWQNCEFWQGFAHMEDSCVSSQRLHIFYLQCVCV